MVTLRVVAFRRRKGGHYAIYGTTSITGITGITELRNYGDACTNPFSAVCGVPRYRGKRRVAASEAPPGPRRPVGLRSSSALESVSSEQIPGAPQPGVPVTSGFFVSPSGCRAPSIPAPAARGPRTAPHRFPGPARPPRERLYRPYRSTPRAGNRRARWPSEKSPARV